MSVARDVPPRLFVNIRRSTLDLAENRPITMPKPTALFRAKKSCATDKRLQVAAYWAKDITFSGLCD